MSFDRVRPGVDWLVTRRRPVCQPFPKLSRTPGGRPCLGEQSHSIGRKATYLVEQQIKSLAIDNYASTTIICTDTLPTFIPDFDFGMAMRVVYDLVTRFTLTPLSA